HHVRLHRVLVADESRANPVGPGTLWRKDVASVLLGEDRDRLEALVVDQGDHRSGQRDVPRALDASGQQYGALGLAHDPVRLGRASEHGGEAGVADLEDLLHEPWRVPKI